MTTGELILLLIVRSVSLRAFVEGGETPGLGIHSIGPQHTRARLVLSRVCSAYPLWPPLGYYNDDDDGDNDRDIIRRRWDELGRRGLYDSQAHR